MRIVLLGTGPFAVPSLRLLHESTHEVLLAVSRPPRGRKPLPAPVQLTAESLEISVWQPETVNSDEARTKIADLQPDLLVVCDYGEILKPETLAVARLGGINLHGSLLPKYRGAAPVQWAILNGDIETGNTVIRMTPGLDAGPIVGVDRVAIDPNETAGELEARLAVRGAELMLRVVDELAAGNSSSLEQDKSQATKAPRLTKEHGQIDWSRSALEIKNQVRALQPWPRAYTDWLRSSSGPLRLIVHQVEICDAPFRGDAPGQVLSAKGELIVATGDGLLKLLEIQPAGKRTMRIEDFLRGNLIQAGDMLG